MFLGGRTKLVTNTHVEMQRNVVNVVEGIRIPTTVRRKHCDLVKLAIRVSFCS